MIRGLVIKELRKFEDPRGWLSEFFRHDESDYLPAMGYVSETKPGVVRGPHEHLYQSDYFVFIGPGNLELHLWDNRQWSETKGEYLKLEVGEKNPVTVVVPPGVVHGYKCVGGKNAWCINLADKLYKGINKEEEVDEVRWEERADSPYIIS